MEVWRRPDKCQWVPKMGLSEWGDIDVHEDLHEYGQAGARKCPERLRHDTPAIKHIQLPVASRHNAM